MKYSIKFTISLIFIFVFAFAAQAQNSEWVRIQSDNGEFSIEMPKNPAYFYDKDGFYYPSSSFGDDDLQYGEMQMLNSADEKTVMSLEIYKVSSPKKGIDLILQKQFSKTQKLENLPKDFSGKQIEKTTIKDFANRKDAEVNYVSRFIASKTHVYIITVANRGAKTAAFDKFLSSARLGGNQTGDVKISSLKALTLTDIGFVATNQPKPLVPSPAPDTSKENMSNPTPLLILSKPVATYTEEARRKLISGTIRLRVTFEKDGRISKIGFISVLQNGLDRNAFFAALRIKFIPLEKEGVLQTISKTVEYSFSIG